MKERAAALGIKVDGRWSESRILEEIMRAENKQIEGADVPDSLDVTEDTVQGNTTEAVDEGISLDVANTRANAIWAGQSSSLTTLERVGRIKLALKKFGFKDFESLEIKGANDYKKYL
jgi:hypothetical protein